MLNHIFIAQIFDNYGKLIKILHSLNRSNSIIMDSCFDENPTGLSTLTNTYKIYAKRISDDYKIFLKT